MGKPRLSSGEQVRVRDKKGPLFFFFFGRQIEQLPGNAKHGLVVIL